MASDMLVFDVKAAQEVVWWSSDPKALIYLYQTFEYWALELQEAKMITVGSITASSQRYLERNGFHSTEQMMTKEM